MYKNNLLPPSIYIWPLLDKATAIYIQKLKVDEVVLKAMLEWQEFEDSQGTTAKPRTNDFRRGQKQTESPESHTECVRLNIASEIQQGAGLAGMGWICRDMQGEVPLAGAELKQNVQKACVAELEAIWRGLEEAERRGVQDVEIR